MTAPSDRSVWRWALAIPAAALFAFPAAGSAHNLGAGCAALVATSYPAGHNVLSVDVAINGQPAGRATYPWDGPTPPVLPVPYAFPVYLGDLVEVAASSTSSDGFTNPRRVLFSSRTCGPERPVVPAGPSPGPLPLVVPGAESQPTTPVVVPTRKRVIAPQRPRPRVKQKRKTIRCATWWAAKPDGVATYRGADGRWHPFYGNRGRVSCGREPLVTGEHRAAQGPAPATIVARLLTQVPALAQDTPFASSIQQGAGARSASGGVSASEKGRLVPAPIPGHPWTSRTTSPRRGVAVSVSWKSGRLTVSVVYSASRGTSQTSVSAR